MKIGILTFHRAINYGAFLQAFALKTFLTSLGHDVEIVDYWPEGHADAYRLFPHSWKKYSLIGKLKFLVSFILRYGRAKKRRDKMQKLVEEYLNLTTLPLYQEAQSLNALSYDCIVYGSDQIWWKSNIPSYLGFDPVYWGEYVPTSIKKIAYAPSMGIINLIEDDKRDIRKWLRNFDALSVREIDLYKTISFLTSQEIALVLDPVFLLSTEEWEKLCIPLQRTKYILYYNLLPSKEADTLVETLSKQMKCDIVEITGTVNLKKIGKRYVQTADAIQFISLIKNAHFVVTSSFHGTAFSLLFKKQFFAIGMGKRAGRVESLLEQLDISNRLIRNIRVIPTSRIDYSSLSVKLQMLILDSYEYLKESILVSNR